MTITAAGIAEWCRNEAEKHRGRWVVLTEGHGELEVVRAVDTERETRPYQSGQNAVVFLPRIKATREERVQTQRRATAAERRRAEKQRREEREADQAAQALVRQAEKNRADQAAADDERRAPGEGLEPLASQQALDDEQRERMTLGDVVDAESLKALSVAMAFGTEREAPPRSKR